MEGPPMTPAAATEFTLNASCLWPIIAALFTFLLFGLTAWWENRKRNWPRHQDSLYNHYVIKERK